MYTDAARQQSEIELLKVRLENAEDDAARLRAALKPLARAAEAFAWIKAKGVDPEGVFLWGEGGPSFRDNRQITAGDAFRAEDALADEQSENDGQKV